MEEQHHAFLALKIMNAQEIQLWRHAQFIIIRWLAKVFASLALTVKIVRMY
jgi:hypothetical protein